MRSAWQLSMVAHVYQHMPTLPSLSQPSLAYARMLPCARHSMAAYIAKYMSSAYHSLQQHLSAVVGICQYLTARSVHVSKGSVGHRMSASVGQGQRTPETSLRTSSLLLVKPLEPSSASAHVVQIENVECLEGSRLRFDFLGKDSIRYENVVEVDPKVYQNIKDFMKDERGKGGAP